jgi:hypothetical protein
VAYSSISSSHNAKCERTELQGSARKRAYHLASQATEIDQYQTIPAEHEFCAAYSALVAEGERSCLRAHRRACEPGN